ncbi:Peptidyl-prolyl cis-trans isomerase CYP40 [Hordeum vulgare]|nr:Peptidyl-prolyl cis-trans isomerase CYP40 [Hordeum vulgare]
MAEAQPLRWRAGQCEDDIMARRAKQRLREAMNALEVVDVGEAESHSPTPRRMHGCSHHNRVVVDIGSSHEGSVIDLTSTDAVRTGSDEEE